MNPRILTLFGEELIVPEQLKVVPKTGNSSNKIKNEAASHSKDGIFFSDEWQPTKQYYSIGEVANLFGVRTSHIRFWASSFELNVRTTGKGDRLFSADNIRELRTIYHLVKERGFTIPGAKARLKDSSRISAETTDLRQSLLKLRNQLLLIRNQLV